MDRFRLVEFRLNGSGPVSVIRELNDGAVAALVRDTLKFTPASPQTILAKSGVRHGGGLPVAQTHDNASCEFELYINNGTAPASLTLLDDIASDLDEIIIPRYLEWRPEGSTVSLYFPLRGPGVVENLYRWIEFQGTRTLHAKFTCTVAPLAEGDRMEIRDDFATNTIADYTFDAGAGTVSVSGGTLLPSTTAAKRLIHTGRGYNYGDSQLTVKVTTGASVASHETMLILRRTDANNYLAAGFTSSGGSFGIWKVIGGVTTNLVAGVASLAASTNYWLRFRAEGNDLVFEYFTVDPAPTTTATAGFNYTLTGTDITALGAAVVGKPGLRISPGGTDWRYDDFTVEPYTYKDETMPNRIALNGPIPGTAPAKVDVAITNGNTVIPFALLAWAQRPTTSTTPSVLDVIEAEADIASSRTGWTVTADAATRGGSKLYDSAVASSEIYNAVWSIHPKRIPADPFTAGEIQVEVWGRFWLSPTLVAPKIITSAWGSQGAAYTSARYTAEYGTIGKIPTLPTAGAWRMLRLGTIILPTTHSTAILSVQVQMGAGSSGTFGLDYIILVPARQRALSPTGKPYDPNYPRFIESTTVTTRKINSDLSGFGGPRPHPDYLFPEHGLGGSQIIFPPGNVDVLVKLSNTVPDDTAVDAGTETPVNYSPTLQFSPIPRYYLTRGV